MHRPVKDKMHKKNTEKSAAHIAEKKKKKTRKKEEDGFRLQRVLQHAWKKEALLLTPTIFPSTHKHGTIIANPVHV